MTPPLGEKKKTPPLWLRFGVFFDSCFMTYFIFKFMLK